MAQFPLGKSPSISASLALMSHSKALSRPNIRLEDRDFMKATAALIFAALAAAAVFGGLVYVVLVAAHVSGPFANTVHGLTIRRLWATTAAVLALVGVVSGAMAMYRAAPRIGNHGRRGAIVALVAGPIAGINGGLNLAVATGGRVPVTE
jgi:hypothetical protein